jgi:cytochrome c
MQMILRAMATSVSGHDQSVRDRRTLSAMRCRLVAAVLVVLALTGCAGQGPEPGPGTAPGTTPARAADSLSVLVFTRTTGFRHASIDDGVAAIRKLGAANGFTVEATDDPARIEAAALERFRVVVFLSTTGDPLDPAQQAALRQWVEGGGGWVGVHAAADAFYGWPWYGELVGPGSSGTRPCSRRPSA